MVESLGNIKGAQTDCWTVGYKLIYDCFQAIYSMGAPNFFLETQLHVYQMTIDKNQNIPKCPSQKSWKWLGNSDTSEIIHGNNFFYQEYRKLWVSENDIGKWTPMPNSDEIT